MACPECQAELPVGSIFCNVCGHKLGLCPKCHKINHSSSKFCLACGHHIGSAPASDKPTVALDAERKQITALFSDLSGYTAKTGQLDPEDVREITGNIFQEIKQVVARYDGFIENGRSAEMAKLTAAVRRLKDGEGSVVCVCGDPGTGKSRLVQEFKAAPDPANLSWLEGHCFPYSQNISYFPLIDLMNRAWRIDEADPPERIREKIEPRLNQLLEASPELIPYISTVICRGWNGSTSSGPCLCTRSLNICLSTPDSGSGLHRVA